MAADTTFLRVNVWRVRPSTWPTPLAKGDRVMVTGRLRQRSWETSEGDKRSVTELEADEVGVPSSGPRPRSSAPASAATANAGVAAIAVNELAVHCLSRVDSWQVASSVGCLS